MGFIFNGGKKAAKIQAKATMDSANMQAAADRVAAQGAVQTQQTLIAQKRASDMASELLSRPQGQADVQLAPDAAQATLDPETGRKRTTRSTFMSKPRSGINI